MLTHGIAPALTMTLLLDLKLWLIRYSALTSELQIPGTLLIQLSYPTELQRRSLKLTGKLVASHTARISNCSVCQQGI